MQGRKPTPTAIKMAAGNPGKRPLNMYEPRPQGDLCDAPEWFNAEQKSSWDYAIENMPARVLKKIDASILVIWVVAECLHREATRQVGAAGMVIKTEAGNMVQNPYLAIINRQATLMMKAASELGFTPTARPRLAVDPYPLDSSCDDDDEFANEFRVW